MDLGKFIQAAFDLDRSSGSNSDSLLLTFARHFKIWGLTLSGSDHQQAGCQ